MVTKHKKTSSKERAGRKSKSAAMQEIRSESQRMVRETAVGLPYHRPRPRTLEEFLNRKKGAPEIVTRLKMGPWVGDSQDADKRLLERQKKMEAFYKSEEGEGNDEKTENRTAEGGGGKEEDEAGCGVEAVKSSGSDIGKVEGAEAKNDVNEIAKPPEEADKAFDSGILTGVGTSDEFSDDLEKKNELGKEPVVAAVDTLPPVRDTDGFRLVLEPDSQEDDELLDTVLGSSQVDKKTETPRASRLALLRSKFDVTQLEQSLDLTPKIGLARPRCGDDIILEEKKEPTLSSGAEKLFRRLISHKTDAEGREVLEKETVVYNRSPGAGNKQKKEKKVRVSFLQLKQSLKEKMLEKRKTERKKRCEMLKMENEEGFGEENEEELIEEEEEDEEESSEGESEPEEFDFPIKESQRTKNDFVDEEAEEEDEDGLRLELDDDEEEEEVNLIEPAEMKSQKYNKIKDPELLSETSTTSDIFKMDR